MRSSFALALCVTVCAIVAPAGGPFATAQRQDLPSPESLPRADVTRLMVLLDVAEVSIPDTPVFTHLVFGRSTVERLCTVESVYACAELFRQAINPILVIRVSRALTVHLERLCTEGDSLSCILRCRFADSSLHNLACDQACTTGQDPAVCYLARTAMNVSQSPSLAPQWFAAASEACDRGVAMGCRNTALPTWTQPLASPERMYERFQRGCALGDDLSCNQVRFSRFADESTRARALERGCVLGNRSDCQALCTDAGSTSDETSPVGQTCEQVISFLCAHPTRDETCFAQIAFDRVRVQAPDDGFALDYLAGLRNACERDRVPEMCDWLEAAYLEGRFTHPNRRLAGRFRALARRHRRDQATGSTCGG